MTKKTWIDIAAETAMAYTGHVLGNKRLPVNVDDDYCDESSTVFENFASSDALDAKFNNWMLLAKELPFLTTIVEYSMGMSDKEVHDEISEFVSENALFSKEQIDSIMTKAQHARDLAEQYDEQISSAREKEKSDLEKHASCVLWSHSQPANGETRHLRIELFNGEKSLRVVADSYIPWSDGRDVSFEIGTFDVGDISKAAQLVEKALPNLCEADFDGLIENERTGGYERTRDMSSLKDLKAPAMSFRGGY